MQRKHTAKAVSELTGLQRDLLTRSPWQAKRDEGGARRFVNSPVA